MEKYKILELSKKYETESGKLLGILEDIQREEGYLSEETMRNVAEVLRVPLSKVYEVATFYSFFSLKPVGKHIITICMGTACYVRGAPRNLKMLEDLLGVKPGETTEDREFTLNTARCFGACSMAPVIRVDGKIYGFVNPKKLPKILKEYGWGEKNEKQNNV